MVADSVYHCCLSERAVGLMFWLAVSSARCKKVQVWLYSRLSRVLPYWEVLNHVVHLSGLDQSWSMPLAMPIVMLMLVPGLTAQDHSHAAVCSALL